MLTDNESRRRELADFLRTRRARLSPQECGLPQRGRRQTKGLRREEVAFLADVSLSWYTKLEQGRDITISVRLLKSLAEALRLTSVERSQLYALALIDPMSGPPSGSADFVPALQRMINAMPLSPAFILTARGDYIGSNEAADRIMGPYYENALGENRLTNLFLDKRTRKSLPDWKESARYQVAVFRAAYGRNAGDPAFIALVDRLTRESPEFRQLWQRHEMQDHSARTVLYDHPSLGRLKFEYFTFYADIDTNLRVDIFTPLDELDSRRKIETLLKAAGLGWHSHA